MANPNPQHNPTDGLGVAAYVQVAGTGITNPSGGSLTHPGSNGGNGQGIGATAGGVFPVAQYALTLSLSSANGNAAACQLTASAVDAKDNSYSTVGSFVYLSYQNPSAGTPAWFRPSVASPYFSDVASVSSTGLITSLHPGSALIEVQFPTFDNTLSSPAVSGVPGTSGTATPQQYNPNEMIYAQILVTVTP